NEHHPRRILTRKRFDFLGRYASGKTANQPFPRRLGHSRAWDQGWNGIRWSVGRNPGRCPLKDHFTRIWAVPLSCDSGIADPLFLAVGMAGFGQALFVGGGEGVRSRPYFTVSGDRGSSRSRPQPMGTRSAPGLLPFGGTRSLVRTSRSSGAAMISRATLN